MLKYATFNTKAGRNQHAKWLTKTNQQDPGQQQQQQSLCASLIESSLRADLNNNSSSNSASQSATSSPLSTPSKARHNAESPANLGLSPSASSSTASLLRHRSRNAQLQHDLGLAKTSSATNTASQQDSIIRVFAQSLSQDVEYITLHVNAQTKSSHIIKSLLKKFRLKHRDPNLYYLTLERFIRKDGLKCKSVMLLGDEACPLQLQQCCSNPPHNDIKFSLLMRAGATVKIFCSDVVPDARYKCLSLSTQTTVEETIELMLHCLNIYQSANNHGETTNHNQDLLRQSNSPGCTSSSSSSTSSSSGIESEPTSSLPIDSNELKKQSKLSCKLNSGSRTSSITSISSSSNNSTISSSVTEQFCLVIECNNNGFRRILESDEYLVDIYQNLLVEARDNIPVLEEPSKSPRERTDSWFFIKLKRRDDCIISSARNITVKTEFIDTDHRKHSHQGNGIIKFPNARKNVPLPPIPVPPKLSFTETVEGDVVNLHRVAMSTAQSYMDAFQNSGDQKSTKISTVANQIFRPPYPPPAPPTPQASWEAEREPLPNCTLDTITAQARQCLPESASIQRADDEPLPLPPKYIFLPPIKPRRRNLSNASSTFGRPMSSFNRRRYDPNQLAEDLNRLDIRETETGLLLADEPIPSCLDNQG